jgi:tetratricopeptide (TPR) repeat protein
MKKTFVVAFALALALALALVTALARADDILPDVRDGAQAMSLMGEPLMSAPASQDSLAKLAVARADYEADPKSADNIIWFGRRTAYTGDYRRAIEIYSEGIRKHPGDARFYRHRGHRYISIRDFDRAIADLEHAAKLIEGTGNQTEPDGLPNALNIPVSSLHGNIWYHLGLAYYLKHDWENAFRAYQSGFEAGRNDDNRVSTTHWRYMILRRAGRDAEAADVLEDISPDMNVIENHVYHRLCLFYKGEIEMSEITGDDSDNPTNSAAAYGVANWFYYNGDVEEANARLKRHLESRSWSAFGFIAAEADIASRQAP